MVRYVAMIYIAKATHHATGRPYKKMDAPGFGFARKRDAMDALHACLIDYEMHWRDLTARGFEGLAEHIESFAKLRCKLASAIPNCKPGELLDCSEGAVRVYIRKKEIAA